MPDSLQSSQSATLPPQTELKDYRIIDLLQKDELGALYCAEHVFLEQPVLRREFVPAHCSVLDSATYAVMVLPGMEDAVRSAYEAFMANIRLWGSLLHVALPGIKTAVSGSTGTVHVVMDAADAQPLDWLIKAGVDVNVRERYGSHILSVTTDDVCIRLLKDAVSSPDAGDEDGCC